MMHVTFTAHFGPEYIEVFLVCSKINIRHHCARQNVVGEMTSAALKLDLHCENVYRNIYLTTMTFKERLATIK